MARKNIETVIEAFARGDKPSRWCKDGLIYGGSGQTCSTNGETIWSYGEPIAFKLGDPDNTVLVRDKYSRPTSTTDRQIRTCKEELPKLGFRVVLVDELRTKMGAHKAALDAELSKKKIRRRQAPIRPHGYCESADHCIEHADNPAVRPCKGDR